MSSLSTSSSVMSTDNYLTIYNDIQDLPTDWQDILLKCFSKSEMDYITKLYNDETKTVYPPRENLFECFKHFNIEDTKVIILGQDPYHKEGQAHGLAFSVLSGRIPPSLRNIYKELSYEYSLDASANMESEQFKTGNLMSWVKQGVLLLNTALTVEEAQPNIHAKFWKSITDKIISSVSEKCDDCVFLLWGNNAEKKKSIIDNDKHFVFVSGHPSPLAAARGYWYHTMQFKLCNEYLTKKNKLPINWC